jgi:hypothetical protein
MKSRTNRELKAMSKGENKAKWIKGAKDKLVRSPGENGGSRMHKNIFTQELEGTRRRGRPGKRWKEEVEIDLLVLGGRRKRESW